MTATKDGGATWLCSPASTCVQDGVADECAVLFTYSFLGWIISAQIATSFLSILELQVVVHELAACSALLRSTKNVNLFLGMFI